MPELPKTLIPHWRIDGTLTTLGPLRIGDGSPVDGRIPPDEPDGKAAKVLGVFVDCDRRAYIPGSSLKGFLRSHMDQQIPDKKLFNAIFGYQNETGRLARRGEGLGGAVTVWDARIQDPDALPSSHADPHWDRQRATCVAPHVVIQRRRRTAEENLLFFEEYVPAGVTFAVTLLVEGGDLQDSTTDEIAGVLLAALQGLNGSSARLGASHAENWGRFRWEPCGLRRLTEQALKGWLQNPSSPLVEHMEPVPSARLCEAGLRELVRGEPTIVQWQIDLTFTSPFLVNDSSRVKRRGEQSDKPNHTPRALSPDQPLLPASSLHGALRSQAERIARTSAGGRPGKNTPSPQDLPSVKTLPGVFALDDVALLFGAPGWRSPLQTSDFVLAPGSPTSQLQPQEFLAVDRFTGGGAEHLKFNATAFTGYGPEGFTLRGTISLDMRRLELAAGRRPETWEPLLYLLAFTLRDLCEGDIPLGFGSAKGYGACTARAELVLGLPPLVPEEVAPLFETLFAARRIA